MPDIHSEIKKINQLQLKRLNNWKYWDIMLDSYNAYKAKYESVYGDSTNEKIILHIEGIMKSCIPRVEERASDEGLDLKQVRVSVAGKYFQALLAYIIADTASENGYRILLDPDLRKYDELQGTVVMLGDTALKPDADLVLYKPDDVMTPIAIFSCKTSLRERIHQSVMWKLLAELSFMKCEYSSTVEGCPVDKYKMDVEIDRDIILGFITMDWYNELANPQYKGISSIFDVIYTSNLNINLPNVRSIDLIFDDIRNDWTGIKT